MIIKKDDKLLVVRYSNVYGEDVMLNHKKTLEKYGYCYFGKFGAKPSQKHYNEIMQSEHPRLLLISKDEAFICDLEDIIFEKPKEGCPKYYDEKIFKKGLELSTYFKIKSIYELGRKNVGRFTVVSSLSNLSESLKRSMTSMMLVQSEVDFDDVKEF